VVGKSTERQDALDSVYLLDLHMAAEALFGIGVLGAERSGATNVASTRYPNITLLHRAVGANDMLTELLGDRALPIRD
jgi:hypothetical protein